MQLPLFLQKTEKNPLFAAKSPLFVRQDEQNKQENEWKTNENERKRTKKQRKKGKKAENGLVWTENLPDFFKKGLCLDGRIFCYTIDEI